MQPAAAPQTAGQGVAYADVGGAGGGAQWDAGGESGAVSGGTVSQTAVGGMAAGVAGKEGPPPPRPEAGSGGAPKPEGVGGAPATKPLERVLWSQDWVVAIHDESVRSTTVGDQMGLRITGLPGCSFGEEGGPSGEVKSYPLGGCAQERLATASGAVRVWSGKTPIATRVGADLANWSAATTGHTVLYLRRTQTYRLDLLSNGEGSYDYADFTGKWEAVGY